MYEKLVTNVSTAVPSIQSEGVWTVRLPVGDHELPLQNVIHVPDLQLNILSAERLKKDNFIGYSNWIPHHLFDGTMTQHQAYGGQTSQTRRSFLGFPTKGFY